MGSCPRVVDFDGDGKKDLITGEGNGDVRIFLNVNTDADPQFNGYQYLQVDGKKFSTGQYSMPWITDWNNDGRFDILVGAADGREHFLKNVSMTAFPTFTHGGMLKQGGKTMDTGFGAAPAVLDLNRDGKKDLIVGDYNGQLAYFENVGEDHNPRFTTMVYLEAGGSAIDLDYYSRPFACDWDEDGVMDILAGALDLRPNKPKYAISMFQVRGPLFLSDNAISINNISKIDLTLDAGVAYSNRDYLVLGSVSGTEPGVLLPGGVVTLPLNWDPVTNLFLSIVNTPICDHFMGTLDAMGQAKGVLDLPGLVNIPNGLVLSLAYMLNEPFDYVSNGANIEIVP